MHLESKKCIKKYEGHYYNVICVKLAPGNRLISGDVNGSIKIWNRESGECIKTISENADIIREILIDSNDKFVTYSNESIRCFDLNNFNCICKIDAELLCCDLLPNDKLVFCDYQYNKIQIWDMNTCRCLKTIKCDASYLKVISDKLIATSEFFNEISIWNIESET